MKQTTRTDSRPYSFSSPNVDPMQPPALNEIPSRSLWVMKRDGLKRLFPISGEQEDMVNEYIRRVWAVTSDYRKTLPFPVAGVFTFDTSECRGDFKDIDAICLNQTSPDGEQLSLIGLDISAIERGGEYVAFLLLHELAHATGTVEHSPHYHAALDSFIT